MDDYELSMGLTEILKIANKIENLAYSNISEKKKATVLEQPS